MTASFLKCPDIDVDFVTFMHFFVVDCINYVVNLQNTTVISLICVILLLSSTYIDTSGLLSISSCLIHLISEVAVVRLAIKEVL